MEQVNRVIRALGCMERKTEGRNRAAMLERHRVSLGGSASCFDYDSHAGCVPSRCVELGVNDDGTLF